MSNCHLHPQQETLGGCTSCGRFVCEICLNKVRGKIVCDTCVRVNASQTAAIQKHSAPLSPQTSFQSASSALEDLQRRFLSSETSRHAVVEVKRELASVSQRNLFIGNVMLSLLVLTALNSFSIVFLLPACVGLWYLWYKRRQAGDPGRERLIVQDIFQLAMLNHGEVSLGQLAAQGRYTMDEYEEEVHKLTLRGAIRQELDEEHGVVKYYMQ
jgi:hypothetical protein